MISDIQAALDFVLGNAANLRIPGGAGRAFELYIMTSVARELQVNGFDVWLQRSDESRILLGDANRDFIQRGGAPTGLAGKSQGDQNASVIGFQWPGRSAWEIWNGIQFQGRSGALHEIDLAIVPSDVGTTLRSRVRGGYPVGRPRVAIECKDVEAAGSADEMRAFVARLYDLSLLKGHHGYLPFTGPPKVLHPGAPPGAVHQSVQTFWEENRRTLNVLARRTGFRPGAVAMTAYHAVEPHQGVVVGSSNATDLIDTIVSWITKCGY